MNYYIIVASKDHVSVGIENSIAQAGHGKRTQLEKLQKGDYVLFYSSKEKYGDTNPYQKFTALGQVEDDEPFRVSLPSGFRTWRRKVRFENVNETEIRPLLDELSFITHRKRWGLNLISGFVRIDKHDFDLIAGKMGLEV